MQEQWLLWHRDFEFYSYFDPMQAVNAPLLHRPPAVVPDTGEVIIAHAWLANPRVQKEYVDEQHRLKQDEPEITSQPSAQCSKAKSRKMRRLRLKQAIADGTSTAVARKAARIASSGSWHSRNACSNASSTKETVAQLCVAGEPHGAAYSEIITMATHPSGQEKVCKLLERATHSQRHKLVRQLVEWVPHLAQDLWGCRVLQKAFEVLPKDEQNQLAIRLQGHVARCAEHQFGNFVLQKCIEQMLPESLHFIGSEIQGRVLRLARHESGCRVIQRLLEFWPHNRLTAILDEIMADIKSLIESRFGNFVVQQVLQCGRLTDQKEIVNLVQSGIVGYAKSKFSSRVVERCLDVVHQQENFISMAHHRQILMQSIIGSDQNWYAPIHQLVDDPYGNYIVQQAIRFSKCVQRKYLVDALCAGGVQRRSSIRRRIVAFVEKELESDTLTAPLSAGSQGSDAFS